MALKLVTFALAAATTAYAFDAPSLQERDEPCIPCNPAGSTNNPPPSVGPALSGLYLDVLASVKDIHFKNRRSLAPRANGFCCKQSLNCINVQSLNLPACYDKFQTIWAFADGSYGSLTTGQYTSGSASANLLTGDYTNGNEQGNIYASNPQDKPNTATLSIPPQFTGTGVGSAIPPSALGSYIVFVTTIPAVTYTAPTTVPQTVRVGTVSGRTVSVTVPAQTITGATTIAPQTTTVTQAQAADSSSSSSHHNGAISYSSVDTTRSFFMSIVFSLVGFLYAL